jgi:2-polyprenyl-3-methyl-5-hydroxy-6-metoxy-1,4-benzoquinol methylase
VDDELGKDNYIKKWFSTGTKSYSYLTNKEKVVTKIKGFILNYKNSKILNLNTIKKLLIKKYMKLS